MRRSSQIRYVPSAESGQQPGGFAGRLIALIIGCVAFVVAVFVGAVFLAGLVGMVLIGWTIFMLRVWWFRRQMDKVAKTTGDLEGQYTVIREEDHRTYRNEDDNRA